MSCLCRMQYWVTIFYGHIAIIELINEMTTNTLRNAPLRHSRNGSGGGTLIVAHPSKTKSICLEMISSRQYFAFRNQQNLAGRQTSVDPIRPKVILLLWGGRIRKQSTVDLRLFWRKWTGLYWFRKAKYLSLCEEQTIDPLRCTYHLSGWHCIISTELHL